MSAVWTQNRLLLSYKWAKTFPSRNNRLLYSQQNSCLLWLTYVLLISMSQLIFLERETPQFFFVVHNIWKEVNHLQESTKFELCFSNYSPLGWLIITTLIFSHVYLCIRTSMSLRTVLSILIWDCLMFKKRKADMYQ